MTILIFTPTHGDGPDPRTLASVSQQTYTDYAHEVSWLTDPEPGRNFRNVVRQYQKGWKMALDGGYEAMLTVEHDMIIPANAIEKLIATDAAVVYGIYMLRHGTPTLSAWQYINNRNMGMSLSLYPKEIRKAKQQGWIEVCGVGWGCTLIRREVLERYTVRSGQDGDAGDVAFANHCVQNNIRQIARFDVPCGHITPEGDILNVDKNGGAVARVYCQQSVTARVDGHSKVLLEGRYYTMTIEDAKELARVGYVRITNDDDGKPVTEPTEKAIDPKATKRSRRAV